MKSGSVGEGMTDTRTMTTRIMALPSPLARKVREVLDRK
jgi:hypothetical protein